MIFYSMLQVQAQIRSDNTCKDLKALPYDGDDPVAMSYADGYHAIIDLN